MDSDQPHLPVSRSEPPAVDGTESEAPAVDDQGVGGIESDGPDFDGPDFDGPDFDGPDFDGPDFDGPDFDGIASRCAVVAGVGALIFTVIFAAIVVGTPIWVVGVWWVLLIAGELLCVPVLVALHRRLATTVGGLSLVALLVGAMGLMGGIAHGGQQLEYVVKPPPGAIRGGSPVELDPRGLFRYLMFGLALLLFAWLMSRSGSVPAMLTRLTWLSGALLVLIYVGRLTQVINPDDRITLTPPVLFGLIVNPAWYFVVARWLRPAAGDGPSPPPAG